MKLIDEGTIKWLIARTPDGQVSWKVLVEPSTIILGIGYVKSERLAKTAIITVIAEHISRRRYPTRT